MLLRMGAPQGWLLIRGCSSAGRAPALQAGGRRFESDHLHHFGWSGGVEWIGSVSRRSESNRCLWFLCETVTPEVSPDGGAVLCQGESGSGASLGATIAKSDRTCPGFPSN